MQQVIVHLFFQMWKPKYWLTSMRGLGADGTKKGHIEVISGNARNNAWYGMQDLHGGNHICSFKITLLSQEDRESTVWNTTCPILSGFTFKFYLLFLGYTSKSFALQGLFWGKKHDVHQKKNSGNRSLGFIQQTICCHVFRSDSVSTLKKPLSVESIYSPILFRMTMTWNWYL